MNTIIRSVIVSLSLACATHAQYTFTTLDVPGAYATDATAIGGDLVGGVYYPTQQDRLGAGYTHGFIYDGSNYTTLDAPNAISTQVTGISGGTVVGNYLSGAGYLNGYLYSNGNWTTFDVPGRLQTLVTKISGN